MGARMRAHDWSHTQLGPPQGWPQSLKSMVGACLNSPMLGAVLWGPDLLMFYNDAYAPSLADRHPAAMGRAVSDVWGGAWQQVAAPFLQVVRTGQGFEQRKVPIQMVRNGQAQTTWWDITATPIRGEDGSVVGLLNQGSEITAQIQAEQSRLQAVQELRALNLTLESRIEERTAALLLHENIVQSHSSAVCAFDLQHRIIAFNQTHSDEFFRIFGYRVQLGEVFSALFPPDQSHAIRAFMDRALAGETYTVCEEFGDAARAKPIWQISYYPLRNREGQIMGAFHHANDISEQVRAQAELDAAKEALRQAQKMESVGQLTGGLAHDFNNLLAGIAGSLELIRRHSNAGRHGDIERHVAVALGATKRAAALTHRLLAFSRRQTLDPKVVCVNRLITGMEELVRRTVGPQSDVGVVADATLWPVKVDASQLENALLNLCINARDAMPGGGTLTIETANRRIDAHTAKELGVEPGEYVALGVSDNGVGMSPDTAARAFDPFFTTKPLGAGTGLGLSMIYGFAKQSGGHVRIHSAVGQGTRVSLYLPRYLGTEVESTALAPAAGPDADGRGQVILLVDDEASVRLCAREILTELGYAVLEAPNGIEALKVLQSGAHLDLLVTDVGLPGGMNGRQVADAARSLRAQLPVLFITGYAENAVLGQGQLDAGMHVITKPFELSAFVDRVERLLEVPAG